MKTQKRNVLSFFCVLLVQTKQISQNRKTKMKTYKHLAVTKTQKNKKIPKHTKRKKEHNWSCDIISKIFRNNSKC